MTTNSDKKLMSLLENHVPESVVLASWLQKNGISRELQKYYLKSGWLESVGHGAFKRPHENVRWTGAAYSLQVQAQLLVHAGALTALSFHGLTHYVRLGNETIFLFSPLYLKLPKWFLEREWGSPIKHVKTQFLPQNLGLSEYSEGKIKLHISSPERAILECLYLAPNHLDLIECYQVMEGLTNLRPKQLQELLMNCNSIKVKRLFLYMAAKANHQWWPFIDQSKIELGKGDRAISKGGVYKNQYRISIPKDLDLTP
jgi:hypothetical protein